MTSSFANDDIQRIARRTLDRAEADASLAADLEAAANAIERREGHMQDEDAQAACQLAARLRAHSKRIGGGK